MFVKMNPPTIILPRLGIRKDSFVQPAVPHQRSNDTGHSACQECNSRDSESQEHGCQRIDHWRAPELSSSLYERRTYNLAVLGLTQRSGVRRYDHGSPMVGIREGCRVVGDYVLNVRGLLDGRSFDDGVAANTR